MCMDASRDLSSSGDSVHSADTCSVFLMLLHAFSISVPAHNLQLFPISLRSSSFFLSFLLFSSGLPSVLFL